MRYNSLQFAEGDVIPASEITLERQPGNEHDPNAVAVRVRAGLAGHLDRKSARMVAPLLDGGATFEVGGVRIDKSDRTSIPLKIWLTYDPERPVAPRVADGRLPGIYAISIASRSPRYIGQARDMNERLRKHWEELTLGVHHNLPLRDLWRELGGRGFTADVVELAPKDLTELALSQWLHDRERHWMDDYESRVGTFNRAPPEIVWTASAKAELSMEARVAAAERKQQRINDKARESELEADLTGLERELANRRTALNEVNVQVRNASGIRGVLFAGSTQKAALPRLVERRGALETEVNSIVAQVAAVRKQRDSIKQVLRPRTTKTPPKVVLEAMIMTSGNRKARKS